MLNWLPVNMILTLALGILQGFIHNAESVKTYRNILQQIDEALDLVLGETAAPAPTQTTQK